MACEVLIVGLNHRSAPVELRERLAFAEEELPGVSRRALERPAVEEAVVISTCNRVEIVAAVTDAAAAANALVELLAAERRLARELIVPHLYELRGSDALRHLFRVASSLDSMVIGEPQILGQLKDQYGLATSAGCAGTILHRCFHKAFSVAKRVRTETAIATRAVSVSSAAVELARSIFDRLEGKTVMLIGAGKMSELAARHLLAAGVSSLLVSNRTFDRAVELARRYGGIAVPFADFPRYLPLADLVIGSVAAGGSYVLEPAALAEVVRARQRRPMFLIDLAVPRCFDPQLEQLDGVYLYDIDDIERMAAENRDERAREAERAEAIVDAEVAAFSGWLATLEAVPTIAALRARTEEIRQREVAKTLAMLRGLGSREREAIEHLTRAIVNKILHRPITHLREKGPSGGIADLEAARRLFGLDDEAAVSSRDDGQLGRRRGRG